MALSVDEAAGAAEGPAPLEAASPLDRDKSLAARWCRNNANLEDEGEKSILCSFTLLTRQSA